MDDAAVIATFLGRYLADREAGRVSSLEEYHALFPGCEDLIAVEFAAVERRDLSQDAASPGRQDDGRLINSRRRCRTTRSRGSST
jgi:hypothetical protein